jgi:hypothetical protein
MCTVNQRYTYLLRHSLAISHKISNCVRPWIYSGSLAKNATKHYNGGNCQSIPACPIAVDVYVLDQQERHKNMLNHHHTCLQSKTTLKLFVGCWLALTFFLLLSPAQTSAHVADKPVSDLTLQLDVGFNSFYRIGYWTPVRVTLGNTGADFSGTLAINTFSSLSRTGPGTTISPWSFAEPVTMTQGTQKQITLTVPLYMGPFPPHGIVARLLDRHGRTIITQEATPEYLNPGDIFVGIFSDHSAGFSPLSAVTLPNRYSSIVLAPLDATTMPATTTVLSSFDIIVFDGFATSTLSPAQLSALQAWVNQGGTLIEVGGAAWQRTLKPLPPELLSIEVHGTTIIPAGTHLLPADGAAGQQLPADTFKEPIIASTATLRTRGSGSPFGSETILSSGTTPLLVQTRRGQGMICYLAFDPALPPFVSWSAITTLWKRLLYRAVGDQALIGNAHEFSSGPGQILARGGLLKILQPAPLLSPWIIGLLLFGYIVVIGPAHILVVRRLKRPQWGWRIIMSSIVIFSLLSYGLSFYRRGASLLDNSISIVQLNANGSSAHITTYHGIFVPTQGDFQVHFPGNSLALPLPNQLVPAAPIFTEDDPRATIIPASNGERVNLPDLGIWPFHALISEQDRQLHGGIIASLSLQNNRLVGSVTNTLDASLNAVYVLLPHGFVSLKHLLAGETQQVDLPVQSALSRPGATLADAIAVSDGLPASYYPYDQDQQPQTDFQRHLAILSALSGTGTGLAFSPCGGPCISQAIVSKGTVILTPPGTPPNISLPNGRDPLLLNGTPATLIGWADRPLDAINDITINGSTPHGFHDNLVQVPLSINVADTLNVPPNIITGYLIDEQDSDAEDTAPDTYSLSTGSVTFEFVLPNTRQLRNTSLTLNEPNALDSPQPQTGPGPHIDVIQAHLYNWQTMAWDSIALTSWTFTTTDTAAYIGPGGRVLVQIANADPSGLLIFGKPWLGSREIVSGSNSP